MGGEKLVRKTFRNQIFFGLSNSLYYRGKLNGYMSSKNRLTAYILLAMLLGVLVGYVVHQHYGPEFIKAFSKNANLLGRVFIRLVQMIISPLVFSTQIGRAHV